VRLIKRAVFIFLVNENEVSDAQKTHEQLVTKKGEKE
jgi:hypothetical protein